MVSSYFNRSCQFSPRLTYAGKQRRSYYPQHDFSNAAQVEKTTEQSEYIRQRRPEPDGGATATTLPPPPFLRICGPARPGVREATPMTAGCVSACEQAVQRNTTRASRLVHTNRAAEMTSEAGGPGLSGTRGDPSKNGKGHEI